MLVVPTHASRGARVINVGEHTLAPRARYSAERRVC